MAQQPSTQHRTIVVVDVAGFTDPSRTMTHLLAVQEGLYKVLSIAFGEAGIDLEECEVEDRGDGALILIPPTISKSLLADQLPGRLVAGLLRYNAVHSDESKVKLRVGLHSGEIHANDHGTVSRAVNHAFRILDAAEAKSALAESNGVLALIASTYFFEEVITQDAGTSPESYRRIPVEVKQTKTSAWLRLPGATASPGRPADDTLTQVAATTPPLSLTEAGSALPLGLIEEPELKRLREMLADTVVPHMPVLVSRATDSVIPLPRHTTAWEVFDYLSDYNAGPDGLPPNLAFLDLLSDEVTGQLAGNLKAWVNQQVSRLRLRTAVQQRHNAVSGIPDQPHLNLVFAVEPDSIDDSLCRLLYWRQDDPRDWPPPLAGAIDIALEDLESHVDDLLMETERVWSGESVAAAVEFVLPRRLLQVPVHLWQKEYRSGDPRPLCLDYRITVRSLERMRSTFWHRLWRVRWRSMLENPSPARVCYSQAAGSKEYRIDAVLSDLEWVGVVMAEAPPPQLQPGTGPDELTAALRSGIPVLFWHPTASHEEIHDIIEWLLQNGGLAELPARVQNYRKSVYQPSSVPFDTDLARDLVVLCDDPTRLIALGQPITPSLA